MVKMVRIIVTGHPVAKGRARAGLIAKKGGGFVADQNGRPVISHHTPGKTRRWEADARDQARAAMKGASPMTGPLELTVKAFFAPSASWPAWKREAALTGWVAHTSKPDGDNLVKAAKDALNGVAWIDDSQVVRHSGEKLYGASPRVEITIRAIDAAPSNITSKKLLAIEQGKFA